MTFLNEHHRTSAQILWDYMRLGQPLKKVDAIMVPGCSDPDCAVYAAELYKQGLAQWFIVSGIVKPKAWQGTRWDGKTEAEAFAQIAIEAGVPADKILIENRATNTTENFWFSEKLMQHHGITIKTVLVVQKPTFERRVYLTAKNCWPNKEITVTSRPVSMADYIGPIVDHQRAVSSMVGDFQRLGIYRGLYWADTNEDIPAVCWDAFMCLADAGYTDMLREPAGETLSWIKLDNTPLQKKNVS